MNLFLKALRLHVFEKRYIPLFQQYADRQIDGDKTLRQSETKTKTFNLESYS